MTSAEKAKIAVKALDSKKGEDIQAIRVRDLTILADYFVIASANNTTQVKTLADEVEYQLELLGVSPNHVEGYGSASWIVLDYGEVVVHVFYKEAREFYSLDRLWSDGEKLDIRQLLGSEED